MLLPGNAHRYLPKMVDHTSLSGMAGRIAIYNDTIRMRQNNAYLVKVQEEKNVFIQHLIDESVELTPTQQETYERIDATRNWLRDGYSDQQVLIMLKKTRHVQDRRAREILALAYEVFAELRKGRNKEGVKYNYAEIFRQAAMEAKDDGDMINFTILMKEAAKIDGAYDKQAVVDTENRKKPQKVTIKVKTMNVVAAAPTNKAVLDAGQPTEDTTYELG